MNANMCVWGGCMYILYTVITRPFSKELRMTHRSALSMSYPCNNNPIKWARLGDCDCFQGHNYGLYKLSVKYCFTILSIWIMYISGTKCTWSTENPFVQETHSYSQTIFFSPHCVWKPSLQRTHEKPVRGEEGDWVMQTNSYMAERLAGQGYINTGERKLSTFAHWLCLQWLLLLMAHVWAHL